MPVSPTTKAGVYACTSANDAITGDIAIDHLWWVTAAGSAKGNNIQITDTASNVSFTAVANASNMSMEIPVRRVMIGFKVKAKTDGTAGKIYVFERSNERDYF